MFFIDTSALQEQRLIRESARDCGAARRDIVLISFTVSTGIMIASLIRFWDNNIIGAWCHRDLILKGRALLINSLLTSTLWYNVTSLAVHF